ncbi:MAG TPA: hypothetical protein VHK05_10665 [Candidatus Limnocylindrales bacterium]|jgi:hypothetical protein|nr:hypothetical protein [Candidatus Limnocylindrales bacterium]
MAKNAKKSGKKGKRGKRGKRALPAPVLAPFRDLARSAPAALAVAAGALIVAGITGLWRVRR